MPRRREGRFVHAEARRRGGWVFLLCALIVSVCAQVIYAGDILRGGAAAGDARKNSEARQNAGAQAASLAKAKAQDRLARTTKAINDMRQMQESAHTAGSNKGSADGLYDAKNNPQGGLKPLTRDVYLWDKVTKAASPKWEGADFPVQNGTAVTIKQTKQQALLHWETFNVGSGTTVNFDQTAGGNDSGKWIAFNKVFDPSGRPSQIRGKINAEGQVYIINQNGIIFGAGSQVNTRTLVASSLPINDNLINQGLLNNKDAQFLFSALPVPGGTDGTKEFTPDAPLTLLGNRGDVVVEAGATISGPVSADGNGGRVMLVGANVYNEGTISTPSGQTILAAGLQVGVQAHDSTDPSLRGLDVWIGDVGSYGGIVTNYGIIEAYTGSAWMAGKSVNQYGVIESSTSVSLNGRIDLIASYGAVGNPAFDGNGADDTGGAPFLSQFTGTVNFGSESITRILPDYESEATVPGTSLPENSQINIQGHSIAMLGSAILLAPHAGVTFQAGNFAYRDVDNNRITYNGTATAGTIEPDITDHLGTKLNTQKFFYSDGQVYLDSGSMVDVSGSTDVFIPLSQNVVTVQLRGTELADSPLQRDSTIRGKNLVVDLRETGEFNGTAWVGTPLGDLTSLAGVIKRNAAQLTAEGGTVDIQAGGSIVIQPGSTVDVSGGYYLYEGGRVQKTRLLRNGNLINIAKATPDVTYDGIYDGRTSRTSAKWGVTKTYSNALAPLGGYTDQEHIAGANGGSISLTAPSNIIGGNLAGQTITGPKQLSKPAEMSSLSFKFQSEARFELPTGVINQYAISPTPPEIRVSAEIPRVYGKLLAEGESLPENLTSQFEISTSWWSSEGGGFGHILLDNRDGDLTLPAGMEVKLPAGGSLAARASNITLDGTITAPGGTVELTAYNYSPYKRLKFEMTHTSEEQKLEPYPDPEFGVGTITLGSSARINVSGMLVDDRPTSTEIVTSPRVLNGGTVALEGYDINMQEGSSIDASGGALVEVDSKGKDKFTYGDGGKISILAGRDPILTNITGGSLTLKGSLTAYSANKGGALSIRANLIQIGGQASDTTMLVLDPEFFRTGGFTSYSLTGIGASTKAARYALGKKEAVANPTPAPTPVPGEDPVEDTYIPAIRIVEGTVIEPVAEQLQRQPFGKTRGKFALKPVLKSEGERNPVSIKFAALGADDSYTTDFVEARGDIVIEKGSIIRTDAGASVLIGTDETLRDGLNLADTVSMEGSIIAPGGTVAIHTRGEFLLSQDVKAIREYSLPTIYIGPQAVISTAGKMVSTPDAFGRRIGLLYSGGTISIHGNIVAEAGAVLDVSGASAIFDIHPSHLAKAQGTPVPVTSGLNSLAYSLRTVPTQLDSSGGLLDLQGSEMLFTDASLLGRAGGPTATGGTLSIFSGRYYKLADANSSTSADINLIVTQSDLSLKEADENRGVGLKVKYAKDAPFYSKAYSKGDALAAMGYFAADSFQQGGFASLDLGYKYFEVSSASPSPIRYGGNVEFRGPVTIVADGSLRVAGGGIIRADSPVNLTARYIAVGQKFREPVNPSDSPFIAFSQVLASTKDDNGDGLEDRNNYYPKPTYGTTGEVNFSANLIDVGTTVFETTGKVSFTAANGDIRGDGTLSVAGDITMTAGQIYPATLAEFHVFAYDYPADKGTTGNGSVTIVGSGTRPMPYSAGGSINIFASNIIQGGTLRAPFGSITLGWDGTDFDLSTTDVDSPTNPVVGASLPVIGASLPVPTTDSVVLRTGSITSVSAVDPVTGVGISIPYGISTDGLSWYDPRGVNVTVSGLPEKRVSIAGNSVTTESGSVIDIRGGGDLLAYRWASGNGGSRDLLLGDTRASAWTLGEYYGAGALVTYKGKTWAARRLIDPESFRDSAVGLAKSAFARAKKLDADTSNDTPFTPKPETGIYWTEVKDSYAVVPGYSAEYAPRIAFNSGENSNNLGGDPGYTSSSLKLGDQIVIDGVEGLAAGTYTLLPKRYALLSGAYLVTPKSSGTFAGFRTKSEALTTSGYRVTGKSAGTFAGYNTPEGAAHTSGQLVNSLDTTARLSGALTLFEVASPNVVGERAEYEVYGANEFMKKAASNLDTGTVQRLPMDSGYLGIQGNSELKLENSVLTSHPSGGRGASIDISSDEDIYVIAGAGSAPADAKAVLKGDLLNSWGAESLLIGGLRQTTEDGTKVNVRARSVTVDNPRSSLSSPEITLVANGDLTVTVDSKIVSSGNLTQDSETLLVGGEGTLLRVSGNKLSSIIRSSFTDSIKPVMTIRRGATISGAGVILDSTYATSLSSYAILEASYLTLSSGQISIVLDETSDRLTDPFVSPHLTLEGQLLKSVQAVDSLTLSSYRTIDIYGTGTFGSSDLGILNLYASGIRGYNGGTVTLTADDVTVANPNNRTTPSDPSDPAPPLSGDLNIITSVMRFGANDFRVAGYQNLNITATNGLIASGSGNLTVGGSFTALTPLITGSNGATYGFTSTGGSITLLSNDETSTLAGGLGVSLSFTGSSVTSNTRINLPSGSLTLHATGVEGDVTVGGEINVGGSAKTFFDITRYVDAGNISLISDAGSVTLSEGSLLDVSAHPDGGNAGTIDIRSGFGMFVNSGKLLGSASEGAKGGSFLLDAGSITSFANVNSPLETGGFTEERNIRVRTGSILIDGTSHARFFSLSADGGSIHVTGSIDASGVTGGSISLIAHNDLVLHPGSLLTVAAQKFSDAGKGGEIYLEAGAWTSAGGVGIGTLKLLGASDGLGTSDGLAASEIDLSVAEFKIGDYTDPTSSAFNGQFQGTLHLRAPRIAGDTSVAVDPIQSTIKGASSILVEAVKTYDLTPTGGSLTSTNIFTGTGGTSAVIPDSSIVRIVSLSGTNTIRTSVVAEAYVPAGATTINLLTSQTVTFPWGTRGTVTIKASVASTITHADGSTEILPLGTEKSLEAGAKVKLSSSGILQFNNGSEEIFISIPRTTNVRVPVGSYINLTGDGTITRSASTLVASTGVREQIHMDSIAFFGRGNASNYNEIFSSLTGLQAAISPLLVIAPGVEIINRSGDLTLGTANNSEDPSSDIAATSEADWDLSAFRYGPKRAPGVLTLRTSENLVFNNTLSDGFTPVANTFGNGNSSMWLAPLKTIVATLPTNTQSWSFRLTAGADLSAADARSVLSEASLAADKGSILVGEFYDAVPNATDSGIAPATGSSGLTANTIRISKVNNSNLGTRYEVIRTGTGDITIQAGRDVQLRNQFATIYTAGVAIPTTTAVINGVNNVITMGIYQPNDFVVPILNKTPSAPQLGAYQQTYAPTWSMAGGDVTISAQNNIGHYTMVGGSLQEDSSRQMPTNWLYRRGYVVDSGVGDAKIFASDGGVGINSEDGVANTINDPSTSTAWWIDFSNFFEGVGALGGGDVTLLAGNDVVNVDAFVPTNARMAGRDPLTGTNLSPSDENLHELGGGDLVVRAGNNIDGGVYYVENGEGTLFAGGSITTNSARSAQLGILDIFDSEGGVVYDKATWLPTTLFVGKSRFDVSALKDVLIGPVVNPFLLPQGMNNKFWYKTYFNTYSEDAGADVASFGGSVTHRMAVTFPEDSTPTNILSKWFGTQNLYIANNASNYQPWLRLAETGVGFFDGVFGLVAPSLTSSAFSGDVNIVGPMTLFPSTTGTLELVASGGIIGIQSTGEGKIEGVSGLNIWTASTVNVSDADPKVFPGITSPYGYQQLGTRERLVASQSSQDPFVKVNLSLEETGSYTDARSALVEVKRALHSGSLLHKDDTHPVLLYAAGGDITGLTLFSPKFTRAIAENDITDISFYLQNVSESDISIVSAGRDVIPYNENSPLRSLATNIDKENALGNEDITLAGDIQINGQGFLEVLAGRNLDLGTGSSYSDGTGAGITSIGNFRNPFLPFEGASIIAMAGVQGQSGGAALGLAGSNLDFEEISIEGTAKNTYATKELEYINTLGTFFQLLQQAGAESETTGSYATGFTAIENLFGNVTGSGEIYTRARNIRTSTGGAITIASPSGGLTMASDLTGNPEPPPGIVTEYGGEVSIFSHGSVDIGRLRIFTLRGGDMTIWSSTGDIAAGTSPKTVVTAPPTRVIIDTASADVSTDLGGLVTGGGIGTLASVEGIEPAQVYLIAPVGTVDAGDAGIRATGDIKIAAAAVLNADNISAGGTKTGVPTAPVAAAPNISGLTSGSSSTAAASSAADSVANQGAKQSQEQIETPSTITVEVLGYGGGDSDEG